MADSTWILDIAAEMPDGAATISELDQMIAKLSGATRRSDDFQAALKRVTADLDAAKAVSASAAAALAQGSEQYKILERDAIRTAKALDNAQAKGRFDPRAARSAHEAQVALDAYTGTLRGLEQAAAAAQGKHDGFARTLANIDKLGKHADARNQALAQRYEKLNAVVGRLPGPLGQIGQRLIGSGKAAHEFGVAFGAAQLTTLAVAGAVVLAVAAVVALTVAVVAGAVAFTRYAVSQADAARTAALSREAFAALSAETAAGVDAFGAVSAATGLADKDLVGLTKQLRDAKVAASDMPKALMAAAIAERALGQGGAGEFVQRLRDGELAVDSFAKEIDDKFGGIVVKQLRGVDAQVDRASKLWGKLFDRVNIEPFLDALGVLVGMLDRANPLAEAFGVAVEGAINPIGSMALEAAYAVEAFALGFAIQLTKMYIAVKPALKWLGEFFGVSSDGTALYDAMAKIGEVAAVAAVVFGVTLAGAVALVGAAFTLVAGVAGVFVAAIYGVITNVWELLTGLYAVGAAVVEWATTIGVDLMKGLIAGITATVSAVVTAVSDAVTLAINTAKEVLGIHSPSKVFAEIGTDTADGFTQGVEQGTPAAQGSMADLVGPDAAAAGAGESGPAPALGGSGGARSFDLSGATFVFNGVPGAEGARDMLAEMFTRLLEDDANSLGGAPEPA